MSSGPFTPPESHLDDEQLCLVVDGLGDPESLAHMEHCPDCGARAAQWRQVRDLVASPPAAAAGDRRDAAIRAALEVFDAQTKQPERRAVIDLAGGRRHQIRRSRSLAAAATAAAGLLLVAGLGIGLSHISHDHTSAAASRSSPVSNAPAASGSASESQPSSAPAAVPAAGAPAAALGSFPDMAALLPALQSQIGELPAGTTTSGSASGASAAPRAPRCQAAASAAAGVAPATVPELHATLTYAGTPAVAYAYRTPASHLAVVLSEASCRVLAKSSF